MFYHTYIHIPTSHTAHLFISCSSLTFASLSCSSFVPGISHHKATRQDGFQINEQGQRFVPICARSCLTEHGTHASSRTPTLTHPHVLLHTHTNTYTYRPMACSMSAKKLMWPCLPPGISQNKGFDMNKHGNSTLHFYPNIPHRHLHVLGLVLRVVQDIQQ